MAFTKIQPQQLQLPTFLSHSGDITFTDNVTGFDANINRNLQGDFDINGTLTISSNEVITTSNSNTTSSSNIILGGTNNSITGTNNVLLNGTANTSLSGNYNVLINGSLNDFGASGQNNTILAGRQCSFDDQITGSVILADHKTTETNDKNHSLLVSFDSGIEFKSLNSGVVFSDDVTFNDLTYFNDSVSFEDQVNLNSNMVVDGTAVFNAATTVNSSLDVTGASTLGALTVTGNAQLDGTISVGSTAYFNQSVTVDAALTVTDVLTLDDGSDAASQVWVNERVGFSLTESVDTGLTYALEEGADYSLGDIADLENVLTGTVLGSDIFTGHVLTGLSSSTLEAYFVLQGANFTGALQFPAGTFTAI